MTQKAFVISQKEIYLYPANIPNMPLIVLNNFAEDGSKIKKELEKIKSPELNLLSIGTLNWNHDMAPWYCPPLTPDDTPCTGGADNYLSLLLNEILPKALSMIKGTPAYLGIAGYSLAGLFSLYALYRCDAFDRAASISGSLWFPDFSTYALNHNMKKSPTKIYISLGDKEALVHNHYIKTVQQNTEKIVDHYKSLNINTTYELNPGNHYTDPVSRTAKGIKSILHKGA